MSRSSSRETSLHGTVGIKDIARILDISIGTVDRALHGRSGINDLTRQRVLKTARALNYHPNLVARHLKSSRPLTFHVHLPREVAAFFDAVRLGIRQAAEPFGSAMRLEFRSYPRLGDGDVELFEKAIAERSDGIIIAPGSPAEMKPLIRKAAQQKIPVVCVDTDAPGTERLTSICADPYTNGAVVAELLCRFRPEGGPVAVITGSLETFDHSQKLKGFEHALQSMGGPLSLLEVLEAHDDESTALRGTKKILAQYPDLVGIYVSTANSLPVLEAIERKAKAKAKLPTIITTDLFDSLIPFIRQGVVSATMYERPVSQGRLAIQVLRQFLVEKKRPRPSIRLVPHIVLKSNLDLILERRTVDKTTE